MLVFYINGPHQHPQYALSAKLVHVGGPEFRQAAVAEC